MASLTLISLTWCLLILSICQLNRSLALHLYPSRSSPSFDRGEKTDLAWFRQYIREHDPVSSPVELHSKSMDTPLSFSFTTNINDLLHSSTKKMCWTPMLVSMDLNVMHVSIAKPTNACYVFSMLWIVSVKTKLIPFYKQLCRQEKVDPKLPTTEQKHCRFSCQERVRVRMREGWLVFFALPRNSLTRPFHMERAHTYTHTFTRFDMRQRSRKLNLYCSITIYRCNKH